MDATLNVVSKTNAGAVQAAEVKDDLKPVQAKSGKLLLGDSLKIINDRSFLEGMVAKDLGVQALVSSWIDQKFAALKEVAKNMGVSEEEREAAERRAEELDELRRKLEDQEMDYAEAVKKFETVGISQGDKAALEMALAIEKPAYV